MRKAKRGFGSGRIASIALMGLLGGALTACDDVASSVSPTTAADTAQPDTGTTTPPATGGTGSGTPTTPPTQPTPPPNADGSPNITLAWEPPTQNSDGSALSDLVGYKIHYGTASQNYTGTLSLSNPGLVRYVVDNLPAGKYYFAVAAYNSKGIESTLSDEVSATLN